MALALGNATLFSDTGPLSPVDALGSFRLEEGFTVEIVAAEPVVVDPVAMAFDETGGMFVAENRGYPTDGAQLEGVIALLRDRDGDGQFETRSVYAEGLSFPNGVLPWRGGVIVTCAPKILFFKDTDGDGRAEQREELLTGFSVSGSTQLRVSCPTYGLDDWIYLASGLAGGKVSIPSSGKAAVDMDRTDVRFRPGESVEAVEGKGQFGIAFDDYGRRFTCMNRIHIQHVVLSARHLRRNPALSVSSTVENIPENLLPDLLRSRGAAARIYPISQNITTADSHAGTFTAACGLIFYRGGAFGPEYQGNAFACDPTGNLVHRDRLEPKGATFTARPAKEGVEFLASTDNWFRPVFLANGPDGGLYVCDMYRKTIEHPQYLPEEVRKRTDFESGKGLGRIYRIRRTAPAPGQAGSNLARASSAGLCLLVASANGWQRATAQRLLVHREDRTICPLLERIAQDENSSPEAKIQSAWTLAALGELSQELSVRLLRDRHATVRENVLQILDQNDVGVALRESPDLADDSDPKVRLHWAVRLGNSSAASALDGLVRIAVRDAADRWTRAAVLSGIYGRTGEFFERLKPGLAQAAAAGSFPEGGLELISETCRIVAATADRTEIGRAVAALSTSDWGENGLVFTIAGWKGLRDGLRTRSPSSRVALNELVSEQTLAQVQEVATKTACDRAHPLAARRFAAGLMPEFGYNSAAPVLFELIEPGQVPELQAAAIRALQEFTDLRVAQGLLQPERWKRFTPALNELALGVILARPEFWPALFDAIEVGVVPAGAVPPARRQQWNSSSDPVVRERARRLFGEAGPEDRMKVYTEYRDVLGMGTVSARGKAVFKQHCAMCHRLDREGTPVGPDLFGMRNQPKEAILLHILVPDYEIVTGYAAYELELKDGRVLSGLIVADTESSVTLRGAAGFEEAIARREIDRITATRLSLMPQELEKNMSRQELADLLAYLKGE